MKSQTDYPSFYEDREKIERWKMLKKLKGEELKSMSKSQYRQKFSNMQCKNQRWFRILVGNNQDKEFYKRAL